MGIKEVKVGMSLGKYLATASEKALIDLIRNACFAYCVSDGVDDDDRRRFKEAVEFILREEL